MQLTAAQSAGGEIEPEDTTLAATTLASLPPFGRKRRQAVLAPTTSGVFPVPLLDDVIVRIDELGVAMSTLLAQLQALEGFQLGFVTIPPNPESSLSGIARFQLERLVTIRSDYEINPQDGVALVYTGCRFWQVHTHFRERVNTTSLLISAPLLAEIERIHTLTESTVLSMLQRALDLRVDVFEEWEECQENEGGVGLFENVSPSAEEEEEGE